MTNGLSDYEIQVLLSKRYDTEFQWLKKKNSMMNDDSVCECEIGLNRETCGLYPIHDFHKNFNKSLNTTASLSPIVSMDASMATTHSTTLQ